MHLNAAVSSSSYKDSLGSHIYTVKVTYTGDRGFLWCFGVMVEHAKRFKFSYLCGVFIEGILSGLTIVFCF